MPSLDEHESAEFTKLIFIGSSGAGKTGAMTSLVKAGYKLRILDMDNGLDALVNFTKASAPDKLKSVEFETIRDKYKATNMGPKVIPPAKAYVTAAKLLDEWSDGTKPAEWGADHILVIDSLTNLAKAAFNWVVGMNPGSKDPRQWYKAAQDTIDDVLYAITSEDFKTNVLVLSHIDFVEGSDGITKGYASSIGKALGPKIPRHFNTMVMAETVGSGSKARRVIKTASTNQLELKTAAPMRIDAEYPLESGLAEIFKNLKV